MEREDKYVIPNFAKIGLAVALCILVGIVFVIFQNESVIALIFVGLSLIFAAVGWDGRRKLGYRWIDSVISTVVVASLVFVIFVLLSVFAKILYLIPQTLESPSQPKSFGIYAALGGIIVCLWPIACALIGHAAAKYLAPKAAQAKPAKQPAKSAKSKRKH